jgi:predicted nucleic acid-binding Zn ribbon protein
MDAVPSHKHCRICGISIPPEDVTCSAQCQARYMANERSRRLWVWAFYAIAIFLVILLAVSTHL